MGQKRKKVASFNGWIQEWIAERMTELNQQVEK